MDVNTETPGDSEKRAQKSVANVAKPDETPTSKVNASKPSEAETLNPDTGKLAVPPQVFKGDGKAPVADNTFNSESWQQTRGMPGWRSYVETRADLSPIPSPGWQTRMNQSKNAKDGDKGPSKVSKATTVSAKATSQPAALDELVGSKDAETGAIKAIKQEELEQHEKLVGAEANPSEDTTTKEAPPTIDLTLPYNPASDRERLQADRARRHMARAVEIAAEAEARKAGKSNKPSSSVLGKRSADTADDERPAKVLRHSDPSIPDPFWCDFPADWPGFIDDISHRIYIHVVFEDTKVPKPYLFNPSMKYVVGQSFDDVMVPPGDKDVDHDITVFEDRSIAEVVSTANRPGLPGRRFTRGSQRQYASMFTQHDRLKKRRVPHGQPAIMRLPNGRLKYLAYAGTILLAGDVYRLAQLSTVHQNHKKESQMDLRCPLEFVLWPEPRQDSEYLLGLQASAFINTIKTGEPRKVDDRPRSDDEGDETLETEDGNQAAQLKGNDAASPVVDRPKLHTRKSLFDQATLPSSLRASGLLIDTGKEAGSGESIHGDADAMVDVQAQIVSSPQGGPSSQNQPSPHAQQNAHGQTTSQHQQQDGALTVTWFPVSPTTAAARAKEINDSSNVHLAKLVAQERQQKAEQLKKKSELTPQQDQEPYDQDDQEQISQGTKGDGASPASFGIPTPFDDATGPSDEQMDRGVEHDGQALITELYGFPLSGHFKRERYAVWAPNDIGTLVIVKWDDLQKLLDAIDSDLLEPNAGSFPYDNTSLGASMYAVPTNNLPIVARTIITSLELVYDALDISTTCAPSVETLLDLKDLLATIAKGLTVNVMRTAKIIKYVQFCLEAHPDAAILAAREAFNAACDAGNLRVHHINREDIQASIKVKYRKPADDQHPTGESTISGSAAENTDNSKGMGDQTKHPQSADFTKVNIEMEALRKQLAESQKSTKAAVARESAVELRAIEAEQRLKMAKENEAAVRAAVKNNLTEGTVTLLEHNATLRERAANATASHVKLTEQLSRQTREAKAFEQSAWKHSTGLSRANGTKDVEIEKLRGQLRQYQSEFTRQKRVGSVATKAATDIARAAQDIVEATANIQPQAQGQSRNPSVVFG